MGNAVTEATRSKGVLLLATIFLLGMASGGAMFYLGQHSMLGAHALRGPRAHRELMRQLDLRPEQEERIVRILRERHEQIAEWLDETRVEIRALLDPEQQEKFDKLHGPGHRRRSWRFHPFRSP